jgi:mannose-6-phosphate isomerase class I
MYKVVRQSEAIFRKIADNKFATNYITKDISPNISLAILEGKNYQEETITKYNRIYYVLNGKLTLSFGSEEISLKENDACFISENTEYEMFGTFKAIVINNPAFGG